MRSALWQLLARGYAQWDRLHPMPTGAWGETWAARYLQAHGCKILGRNVRPTRRGEIDIIALQGKRYLFVEVKTRRSEAFGRPLTAITLTKRRHLRTCATHWLAQQGKLSSETPIRFDGFEVIGQPQNGIPKMRWVRGLNMSGTRAPDLYD